MDTYWWCIWLLLTYLFVLWWSWPFRWKLLIILALKFLFTKLYALSKKMPISQHLDCLWQVTHWCLWTGWEFYFLLIFTHFKTRTLPHCVPRHIPFLCMLGWRWFGSLYTTRRLSPKEGCTWLCWVFSWSLSLKLSWQQFFSIGHIQCGKPTVLQHGSWNEWHIMG